MLSICSKTCIKLKPMNKNEIKCFQYAPKLVLNYKEIRKHSERKTKIKLFIDKYNEEGINYKKMNGKIRAK